MTRALANLTVFRFVKEIMEEKAICPTPRFVAAQLHMEYGDVIVSMRAIQYADGLPFYIPQDILDIGADEEALSDDSDDRAEDVLAHFNRQGIY